MEPHPRILVVDDDADTVRMLTTWLEQTGYRPHGVTSGLDALAALREDAYDVIVTDLRMPGLDGLQLLTILEALAPDVPVIFLSGQGTLDDAIRALRGGRAFDFLQKPLRQLRDLNTVIDAAVAQQRLAADAAPAAAGTGPLPRPVPVGLPNPLSESEIKMVRLLAEGNDNREIAELLCFSEKTVRNYLSRVYEKLGVDSRLRAVAACRQHGLLD